MIDIKQRTVHAFKTVFNRCGSSVTRGNVFRYSASNLPDTPSVKKQKITSRGSRYSRQLLLLITLVIGVFSQAQAGIFCSDDPYFGVIDGATLDPLDPFWSEVQVTIDDDCIFRNFTADNPLDVTFNFQTDTKEDIYLISFDNVVSLRNMACAAIDHKLWVVNSSGPTFEGSCQDLLIPAESISKQASTTSAGIGDPFTYTLILPAMNYPEGNDPSADNIDNIILVDDLNAMGVDVTLVGIPEVTLVGGDGATVPHTFTNDSGLLTFGLSVVEAGTQVQIKITVVLADTPNNFIGKQFTNIATWIFSRWINLADPDAPPIMKYFDPLPGESGISQTITIAGSELTVTKSSSETALNVGVDAPFTIDVHNTGATNVWNATIIDLLPDLFPVAASSCAIDPSPSVTAAIFATDGTPVSGLLDSTVDYSVTFTDGAPTCELKLVMQSAKTVIKPGEHLIINYVTQLDSTTTANDEDLVNVAGATQWFSAADATYGQTTTDNTLTDGTPLVSDFQDSHTLTTALSGYYFQKTVQNLTSGGNQVADVTLVAAPADTLQYRLRVFNVDRDINNITITDQLDPALFNIGSFDVISKPDGSLVSIDGLGKISVVPNTQSDPPSVLSVSQGTEIIVDFQINLAAGLSNGLIVPNQARLLAGGGFDITSDDPYKDGIAKPGDPAVPIAPDPTNSTDVIILAPGPLTKVKPAQTTAVIGEQLTYTITVPKDPVNVPLYDVRIIDVLSSVADLSYVSASAVSLDGSASWTLTPTVTSTSVTLEEAATGIDIPANGQAVIEITVALQNTTKNQAGVDFTNTASYTYNRSNGDIGTQADGAGATSATITIVEPLISEITKTALPTAPTAGEIVRYSVFLDTSSVSNFSDVFDVIITDTLSAGLVYYAAGIAPTVTDGAGISADNDIGDPIITGDGSIDSPQTLLWSFEAGNADIDIVAGQSITVSYDVRVLDSVLAGQTLTNSAVAQWTSIDGTNTNERNGTDGIGLLNDYTTAAAFVTVTTPPIISTITKIRSSDTYDGADNNVRIGDIVDYTLTINMSEGTMVNAKIIDILPKGLDFESVVSINGDSAAPYAELNPFTYTEIPATNIVEAGTPATGQSTVTFTLGSITNKAIDDASNDFVIVYRARVLNSLDINNTNIDLNNTVSLTYDTSAGTQTRTDLDTIITVLQPKLTINKIATPAGGDNVIVANEVVTYTIEFKNTGEAPAYDLYLQDLLPAEMRNTTPAIVAGGTSIEDANGVVTVLADPAVKSYTLASGDLQIDLDSGVANTYTIPAGETLRIKYTTQANADLTEGLTITNQAKATSYYSFDNEAIPVNGILSGRQTYSTATATSTIYTGAKPTKVLLTSPTATIGEEVIYKITVPGTVDSSPLYDVDITDVLNTSLLYGSSIISGGGIGVTESFTVATNTLKILVDEIPAGEQVVVEVHAFVKNTLPNPVKDDVINNKASYIYAYTDGGIKQGALESSVVGITIIESDITLVKTGPATMRLGILETFTLDIHNTGNSSAWDLTITDILPNPAPGGMCDASPSSITAKTTLNDGTTLVNNLVAVTDYDTVYDVASCTFKLTMKSANAAVAADNRLIITYQTQLDADNVQGATLTNLAGATEWFSLDTAGAGATDQTRTYTRALTDIVTAAAALDYEDSHEVVTEVSVIQVLKSVQNVTTGGTGADATPGDKLRYTIRFENVSPVEVTDFQFVDDLDELNTSAAFAAGTLVLDAATIPAGTDVTNTNDSGGVKGTGIVDLRNLSLGADDSATDIVTISFEVVLAASIKSGTVVLNQGKMIATNLSLVTDDPAIDGAEDPNVAGDENKTETLISSVPLFEVLKTSTDITGDAAILLPGDTLRYTLTVKNTGTEDSINTILKDQLPANTTYVAGSTRLNGTTVSEAIAGTLPLQAGVLINAPENTTPGYMRADATVTTANVATITFDVVIDNTVVNGSIILNQAYVSASGAGSGLMADTPSDDPATVATLNDPTLDVIGDQPLVDALKTVSIQTDTSGNGQLDPGDVLRYSITISNLGAANATGVSFDDSIPANTTYVPNSVTLNTIAVPDAGGSPLIAGIPVSSSDLTPPLPTAGNGVLTAGQSAVITFDVEINALVASGTIISNQGNVSTNEQPVEPTDADGIDSNGDQATLIIVGNTSLLSITKTVSVVGGGAALADGQLEYRILVTNISSVAATNVTITDNLDLPVAGQLTYVNGSGLLNGFATGVSYTAPNLTADYATPYGNLLPGETAELVFRATINSALAIGTTITNTGDVSWNAGAQNASATISIDVGGIPGVANVNGKVWHDANFNNSFDAAEVVLSGWNVDIYRNTTLLGTVITDATGNYSINGLIPNDIGTDRYDIRFRAPGSTAATAKLGLANSPDALGYTDALHRISNIVLASGSITPNLNLPIDPNGVVYNSIIRTAIAGATISLLDSAGTAVSQNCFDDVNQQNQVTTADGYYKFDLNFSQGDCTAGGDYLIRITPPATGYNLNPSVVITPQTDETTAALDVPTCPGTATDAIPATSTICEATTSELAPNLSVPAASAGTNYYLNVTLSNGVIPDDSQLFNNHLPIDPVLTNAVSITKTSAFVNVTRSKLVPYTITVKNGLPVILSNSNIVDNYPAGFKYVKGSARVNGVAQEPTQNGLQLTWSNIDLIPNETQIIKLLLIVGAAVNEGKYINRAQVIDTLTNKAASEIATATVRVVADPDFDCSHVVGKVFDDKNFNGYQDEDESGLAGVNLVTVRGLVSSSDKYGRFHITCAATPNESRGSNFILKVDERTLPSGYRMTTENPRVQRATRGKMLKFRFGSALHRVVSMDLADDVFVSNSTEIHKQWLPRIDLLIKQLQEKPSILRLSYLADVDDESIVDDRLEQVKQDIIDKWLIENKYKLKVETEIFWRRGGPPNRGDID